MSNEQAVDPLWSDSKIVDESGKSPDPTEFHEVVTRAYAIGLCVEMRNEYEAERQPLHAQLTTLQQANTRLLAEREQLIAWNKRAREQNDSLRSQLAAQTNELRQTIGERDRLIGRLSRQLETAQAQVEQLQSGAYQPLPDGVLQWSEQEAIRIKGAALEACVRPLVTFYDTLGEPHQRLLGIEMVEITLPAGIKVCRWQDGALAHGLDAPDGPGWWAFEGAEWMVKRVPCTKDEADYVDEGEWDEGDEPDVRYYKLVEGEGEPFRLVLDVRWVHPGMSISTRRYSGHHSGEPVLGFVSPKYRWNHALYGIDTLIGKWYRQYLPWDRPVTVAPPGAQP